MHRPDVDLHLTGVSSAEGGGEEGLADPQEKPSEVQAELMDKGYVIVPAISHNSGTRAHVEVDTATTWVEPQPVTRELLQETSRLLWKVRPEGTRAVEKVVKASQQYYGISPSCKIVRKRVYAISTARWGLRRRRLFTQTTSGANGTSWAARRRHGQRRR